MQKKIQIIDTPLTPFVAISFGICFYSATLPGELENLQTYDHLKV